MERNNLFPIFLRLESLETLIVGGGHVGFEKLSAILKNSPSASVTLVARTIQEPIRELAHNHPRVKLHERNFKLWDLWDKDIVLLATDNRKPAREHTQFCTDKTNPGQCRRHSGSM